MPSKKMPLNESELAAYEATRDVGADILQAIHEMNAGEVHLVLSPIEQARSSAGLSEQQFARILGVSVATLQEWERGAKQPSGAARTLISIAVNNPPAFLAELAREAEDSASGDASA